METMRGFFASSTVVIFYTTTVSIVVSLKVRCVVVLCVDKGYFVIVIASIRTHVRSEERISVIFARCLLGKSYSHNIRTLSKSRQSYFSFVHFL